MASPKTFEGDAELFEPTLITTWSQYLENFAKAGSDGFTDFGAYLPFAIKGWFDNGGGRCWVVSMGTQLPSAAEDAPDVNHQPLLKEVNTSGKRPSLKFQLTEVAAEEGRVNVIIKRDEPRRPANPDDEPFDTGEFFKVRLERNGELLKRIAIEDGQEREIDAEYRHLTMKEDVAPEVGTFVGTALQDSEFVQVEIAAEPGLPLARRPANGTYEVSPPLVSYSVDRWYPKMYGTRQRRSGVQGLFEIDGRGDDRLP